MFIAPQQVNSTIYPSSSLLLPDSFSFYVKERRFRDVLVNLECHQSKLKALPVKHTHLLYPKRKTGVTCQRLIMPWWLQA